MSQKKSNFMPKLLLLGASLFFTGYVFLNTYEVVFNEDVVVAKAIHEMTAQNQINAIIKQFDLKPEAGRQKNNAEYNRLERIQIPAITSNLYLEERRVIDSAWYMRQSMGHVVGLNKDDHGAVVDYLIYTDRSWRTLPDPNQIEEGVDVKLFHDGGKVSVFRVDEKKVLPLHTTFVASKSENRQVILLIEDPANDVYYGFSLVLKD